MGGANKIEAGDNLRLIHHRTPFYVETLLKSGCSIDKVANSFMVFIKT